jgi:hypothetical protein
MREVGEKQKYAMNIRNEGLKTKVKEAEVRLLKGIKT